MSSWTDMGAGMRLPTDGDITVPPLTDEQRHKAALEVCARAVDSVEAAELLAMLGLSTNPSAIREIGHETWENVSGPEGARTPTPALDRHTSLEGRASRG